MLPRLRKALRAAADPRKAPLMQAAMKSDLPYHGVPVPLLRKLCRSIFASLQFASAAQWQELVLDLWRHASDPAEVNRYVRRHRERLSGLSLREAQKNLD